MKTTNKTIVAFHVGRGGKFNNAGFKSFIGSKSIGDFTGNLFLNFENEMEFKNRFGFDWTGTDQKCILDLITDLDFSELEEKFGITEKMLGEAIYSDGGGNPVGLTLEERESGIGTINIDEDYDTTYTCYINDCGEDELKLIIKDAPYNLIELMEEAGYDNVDVWAAFDMLTDMVDSSWFCFKEITEEEAEEDDDSKKVGDKYYTTL